MIEFYINGQQVEVQLEDEQTIGDVLKSFEKTCEENEAAVIGIVVDGKQITADLFDEEAAKPLKADTKFEFSVVTEQSIKDSFAEFTDDAGNLHLAYIVEMVPAGRTAPLEYCSERIKDIILSARKHALETSLEKDLLEDALESRKFVIY